MYQNYYINIYGIIQIIGGFMGGKLQNERKIKLAKIEIARLNIKKYLEDEFITVEDIISLSNIDKNYGVLLNKKSDCKTTILRYIYNCPFLLCDQESASIEIKQILPLFLQYRYNMEIKELDNLYEQGDMDQEEYYKQKAIINFCYYNSSKEGKEILKYGRIQNITDNVIRYQ